MGPVTRPTMLLADEPTGKLDSQRRREVMKPLAALNRGRGITVLMVPHEPEMTVHARRVAHFVDGLIDSDRPQPETAPAIRSAAAVPVTSRHAARRGSTRSGRRGTNSAPGTAAVAVTPPENQPMRPAPRRRR